MRAFKTKYVRRGEIKFSRRHRRLDDDKRDGEEGGGGGWR